MEVLDRKLKFSTFENPRWHSLTGEHLTEQHWQPVFLFSKPIVSIHVCCSCIELSRSKLHKTRACERRVSGAENGAERVKNSWSGSGAVSGLQKSPRAWAERGAAWITRSNSAPTTLILGFTNRSHWCWYKVHRDRTWGYFGFVMVTANAIDNVIVLLPYADCR